MDNLGIGLELLVVGMTTVFLILVIVILLGNVLINFVNKYIPEETTAPKKATPVSAAIDGTIMTVLSEAVKQLTGNKGVITKVEKL